MVEQVGVTIYRPGTELDVPARPRSAPDLAMLSGLPWSGVPVRLRLFSMIAAAGGACSCNLVEPLGKSQPTVSHHTKVLAEAGLITGEKAGRWVNWSVVPERLELLRAALDAGALVV